ncbi:hypothetical protein VF21_04897 [Pseudogymnoascus sp. 05NY08]|nr:hypothetical protein VF21_04897 [Pseudogymnoascus sp. 05NY08]
MNSGLGVLIVAVGKDMDLNEAFYSADDGFLIVVQHGVLDIQTELGYILARPNEIVVIPRGVRHRVSLPHGPARGYILELYQGHFRLPELGPIGSNGLASARDFQVPVAAYMDNSKAEDGVRSTNRTTNVDSADYTLVAKFDGKLFQARQNHTPFDVVAWHRLYYPYKYDLGRFNVIGSTSFDHPDPSIYTVLTGPSDHMVSPRRYLSAAMVPPKYDVRIHGIDPGDYDAKTGGGFKAAGASLHNVMGAHGPDSDAYAKASAADLKSTKVGEGSMTFMFESSRCWV